MSHHNTDAALRRPAPVELMNTHISSILSLVDALHFHLEIQTENNVLEKGVEALMLTVSLYQRTEEYLMEKYDYPNIQDHLLDYEPFEASILTIGLLDERSDSAFVNLDNFSKLMENHIKNKDSDLIKFLETKL